MGGGENQGDRGRSGTYFPPPQLLLGRMFCLCLGFAPVPVPALDGPAPLLEREKIVPPKLQKKASNRGVRNKKSFERSGGIKASAPSEERVCFECALLFHPCAHGTHAACVLVLLGALLLQQLFQEPAQQQRLRLRRVFTKTAASSSSLFFHHQMEEEGGGYLSAQVDGWIAIPPQLYSANSTPPLPFRPSVGRELSLPMNPESPPPSLV